MSNKQTLLEIQLVHECDQIQHMNGCALVAWLDIQSGVQVVVEVVELDEVVVQDEVVELDEVVEEEVDEVDESISLPLERLV